MFSRKLLQETSPGGIFLSSCKFLLTDASSSSVYPVLAFVFVAAFYSLNFVDRMYEFAEKTKTSEWESELKDKTGKRPGKEWTKNKRANEETGKGESKTGNILLSKRSSSRDYDLKVPYGGICPWMPCLPTLYSLRAKPWSNLSCWILENVLNDPSARKEKEQPAHRSLSLEAWSLFVFRKEKHLRLEVVLVLDALLTDINDRLCDPFSWKTMCIVEGDQAHPKSISGYVGKERCLSSSQSYYQSKKKRSAIQPPLKRKGHSEYCLSPQVI